MPKSKQKLNELSPQYLCDALRNKLRAVFGNEIADESDISYHRGWFYFNQARKFSDGSVGTIHPAECYRKKTIICFIIELSKALKPKISEEINNA